ncbi:serine/threonine protein kinase [Candidatus Sumerlaeota bacterium]|nr:serine/threonine protein kinase [Candidatus Sumerlaeota bacterium]
MSVPELKDSAQENLGGRLIGNYELLRELGRGAMGVVYKAHESSLNRMVALKVLPQHLARDEAFLKRFHREARTVAQLNHPNVVTIFNIGADDGIHYIAMEYVKGKALSDIIQEEGQLEIRRALEIARQVAGALDAAHQMKIIHRDIKPHNIMVDELGRAKVLDFGIAKVQEEKPTGLTHTGQVLGTPHYMAPEQCRGLEIDGRTDIYSLGVSLYEMLAGSLPFTGHTAVVVIQKILFEEPTPLGQFNGVVPPSVIHIINKSIARERDDRYQSAADFEEALRRAIIEMDRRSSLDPHERATNFESDRIPIEESTGFLRQLPRVFRSKRNRMTA